MGFLTENMVEMTNKFITSYFKVLEDYCEHILKVSDYTVNDITSIVMNLKDGRKCYMVVCPKYCIVEGIGISNPEYFLGIEEQMNNQGFFNGFEIINEPPLETQVNEKLLIKKHI